MQPTKTRTSLLPIVITPIQLALLLLLCGFFWNKPTWQEINRTLERKYPTVSNIDTDSLKESFEQQKIPVLIDVREENEFAVSHLPTAVNIASVDKVLFPHESPIVVYCSVGLRSAEFAKQLEGRGYTQVLNLRGSIFEWGNKGYPLRQGEAVVKVVHPYNKKWGTLLNQELHQY